MKICTFFGHRDAPSDIRENIKSEIKRLIETENIKRFYVGTEGAFDRMAIGVLKEIKASYSDIEIFVVLAYLNKNTEPCVDIEMVFPEELEIAPKKYAINYRNEWMLSKSEWVIVYVTKCYGGAYKFKSLAERKGKTVINIADKNKG